MKKTYLGFVAIFLTSNAFGAFDIYIKNKCDGNANVQIVNGENRNQYKLQRLRKNETTTLQNFNYPKVEIAEQYSLILGYRDFCKLNTPLSPKIRIDVTLMDGEKWFSCKPICSLTVLE